VMPSSSSRSGFTTREKIKKFYKSFENVKGGLAVIMSSASEEISLEAKNLEQGVFSYYFMQGLKGHADGYSDEYIALLKEQKSIKRKLDRAIKKNDSTVDDLQQTYDELDEKMKVIFETDEIITVEELYNFIRKEVKEFTFNFQNPIINDDKLTIERRGEKIEKFIYDKKMPIGISRLER
ncbi:MAG: hypothetical protein MK212_08490, partial [Saprospiraceae bacterium]|nr:hypothetical protein [Saprospiraceae bacterium]